LAFASWLLGPSRPTDVTVFLIEAASFEPGAPLTAQVEAGMRHLIDILLRDFLSPAPDAAGAEERGAGHAVTVRIAQSNALNWQDAEGSAGQ
jgi:hypothetical protein